MLKNTSSEAVHMLSQECLKDIAEALEEESLKRLENSRPAQNEQYQAVEGYSA